MNEDEKYIIIDGSLDVWYSCGGLPDCSDKEDEVKKSTLKAWKAFQKEGKQPTKEDRGEPVISWGEKALPIENKPFDSRVIGKSLNLRFKINPCMLRWLAYDRGQTYEEVIEDLTSALVCPGGRWMQNARREQIELMISHHEYIEELDKRIKKDEKSRCS